MQIVTNAQPTSEPMQPAAALSPSSRFFWDHAQWFTRLDEEPAETRTELAQDLADAEANYLDADSLQGFTFRVRANRKTTRPRTWTMWIEQADGQAVAWLSNVQDASPSNRRVVRAELAIDAKETMQAAASISSAE